MAYEVAADPMHLTGPLRASPPRYPLDIHPLARLRADGSLELLQAAFPPFGEILLVLWEPGVEPAFRIVAGRLERGWRFRGPTARAFVVCWLAVEAPKKVL